MQILDHFSRKTNSNVIIFNKLNKNLKLIEKQNYKSNNLKKAKKVSNSSIKITNIFFMKAK